LVETAGVEGQFGAFTNWLTTRDFGSMCSDDGILLPLVVSTDVDRNPGKSTLFLETLWRRRGSASARPAAPISSSATMDGRSFMMAPLTRITFDPEVMGGKPCIRGLRVTVGTIVGLVAAGRTSAEILAAYPYLEEPDIREALSYAAWRVEETEVPLAK
jgi:uncharacterized protein (DUF433 family)